MVMVARRGGILRLIDANSTWLFPLSGLPSAKVKHEAVPALTQLGFCAMGVAPPYLMYIDANDISRAVVRSGDILHAGRLPSLARLVLSSQLKGGISYLDAPRRWTDRLPQGFGVGRINGWRCPAQHVLRWAQEILSTDRRARCQFNYEGSVVGIRLGSGLAYHDH